MKRRRLRRSPRTAAVSGAAFLLAVLLATAIPPPPGWIENGYANGLYAALNRGLVPLTNVFPFALGDLIWFGIPIATIVWWVRRLRAARGARAREAVRLAGLTATFAAWLVVAFELGWALNYHRATVAQRLVFEPSRVSDAAIDAFAKHVVEELNATAPLAHAEPGFDDARVSVLGRDFGPVVRRLGDRWDVALTRPKQTIADIYFRAAGIGGMYDPLAFETLLNGTFLPFETPRALAHEWAHVAGFTDEGDANYVGTIACLRSPDALIRYSGWFWTYGQLPDDLRRKYPVSPSVSADLAAAQRRYLRWYRPQLFAISWRVYDRYLTAQHVAGGVRSYARYLQLLVGVPLDADGLPRVQAALAYGRGETTR